MHRKLARKNTEYTKILHIARRRGGDSEDDNKFRVSKCSLFKYVCSFTIRSTGTRVVEEKSDPRYGTFNLEGWDVRYIGSVVSFFRSEQMLKAGVPVRRRELKERCFERNGPGPPTGRDTPSQSPVAPPSWPEPRNCTIFCRIVFGQCLEIQIYSEPSQVPRPSCCISLASFASAIQCHPPAFLLLAQDACRESLNCSRRRIFSVDPAEPDGSRGIHASGLRNTPARRYQGHVTILRASPTAVTRAAQQALPTTS